jgi:integrase
VLVSRAGDEHAIPSGGQRSGGLCYRAQAEADKLMRRLASEVDERRNPRTSATVNQLLDRHFELAELEENTLTNYRNLAAKHIRPLIGTMKVGELDGYLFDSFYAALRRCRDHCDRRQRALLH